MERRDIERWIYVIAFLLYGLYELISGDMPRGTVVWDFSYVLYGVAVALGIFTLPRHRSATALFGLYMYYSGVVQLYLLLVFLYFRSPGGEMLAFGDVATLCAAGILCFVGGCRLIVFALEDLGRTGKTESTPREARQDAGNSTFAVERALYCFGVPLVFLAYIYIVKDGAGVLSGPNFGGMRTLYIITVAVPSLYLLVVGVVSFFQRRFPAMLYGGYLIGLGVAFFLTSRIVPRIAGYLSWDPDAAKMAVVGFVGLLIGLRVVHLGLKQESLARESVVNA